MRKFLLIWLLLYAFKTDAQTGTSVSPGTLNMGGGTVSITPYFFVDWSMGESTIIETYYGRNSTATSNVGFEWNVTSGILQPYDNTNIVFNFLIPNWTSQEIRLFPIPTHDKVFIDFRSITTGKITIQLLGRDGKTIGTKEFNHSSGNSTQQWNFSNQPSGFYFFRILLTSDKGDILKQGTFKVEKI
jgi:hypothetical protein